MGLFRKRKDVPVKEEEAQGILTLYSVTLNSSSFYEIARDEFAEEIKQSSQTGDDFIIVLKDDIKIKMI